MTDALDKLAEEAIIAQNESAWPKLVAEAWPDVYRYCRWRIAGNSQVDPEDLAMNVFTRVWMYRNKWRQDQGSFRQWLFTIARNECYDAKRMSLNRSAFYGREVASGLSAFDTRIVYPDAWTEPYDSTEILEAVSKLPLRIREAVVMHYWQNLSPGEVAVILKVSAATVRTRLLRGRRLLRSLLQPAGEAERN